MWVGGGSSSGGFMWGWELTTAPGKLIYLFSNYNGFLVYDCNQELWLIFIVILCCNKVINFNDREFYRKSLWAGGVLHPGTPNPGISLVVRRIPNFIGRGRRRRREKQSGKHLKGGIYCSMLMF